MTIFRRVTEWMVPGCVLEDERRGEKWNPLLVRITCWAMVVYVVCSAEKIIDKLTHPDWGNFSYTEFAINFSGGFVRRGALGELIHWLCVNTGMSPTWMIWTICVVSYLVVTVFLCRKFSERGFCWWLVFSTFLCGYTLDVIRKDFLMYCIMIGAVLLIKNQRGNMWRPIMCTVLLCAGIFIHEAFIFFGAPVCLVYLFSQKGRRWWAVAAAVLLSALFLVMCYYKGDGNIAGRVIDSWRGMQEIGVDRENAISALSWNLKDTAIMHFRANIAILSLGSWGVFFRGIIYLTVYYFLMNFNRVFAPEKFTQETGVAFGSVYWLTTLTMIPMFVFLSCDYGRDYQYVAMASFIAVCVWDAKSIIASFPRWFVRAVGAFNAKTDRFITPSRGLLWTGLMLLAVTQCSFFPSQAIYESVMGQIISWIFGKAVVLLSLIKGVLIQ